MEDYGASQAEQASIDKQHFRSADDRGNSTGLGAGKDRSIEDDSPVDE